MVDNVQLSTNIGVGEKIATDDDGTAQHQYVKLEFGADNTQTKVDSSNPLPVDVFDVVPGTGATNLGKAEDSVHTSGDVGVMPLTVRKDDLAPLAADGKYTPILTDKFGAQWVVEELNEVDSNNSSTTPLGSGATFTGAATNVLGYSAITVNMDSDVDSATDGMQLQLSSDGVFWDIDRPFNYVAINSGAVYQQSASAKFFRVVYTNGGSGQSTIRLQTILHHSTPIGGTHRLVDDEDPDSFTILVKSAIVAQAAGTGDFKPVQSTAIGNLKVSIEQINGSVAGGGAEATALRVTMANDSTGLLTVSNVVRTSGGTTPFKNIDVDESEDEVKGSAGQVYWIHAINLSSSVLFLKFYNATAASVTVGSTVPDLTYPIPTQGDSNGAGFTLTIPNGIEFTTAITIAATTGLADNDAGAPGDNEVVVNLGFA